MLQRCNSSGWSDLLRRLKNDAICPLLGVKPSWRFPSVTAGSGGLRGIPAIRRWWRNCFLSPYSLIICQSFYWLSNLLPRIPKSCFFSFKASRIFFKKNQNTKLRERRKTMERIKGRRLVWEQLMRLHRAPTHQSEWETQRSPFLSHTECSFQAEGVLEKILKSAGSSRSFLHFVEPPNPCSVYSSPELQLPRMWKTVNPILRWELVIYSSNSLLGYYSYQYFQFMKGGSGPPTPCQSRDPFTDWELSHGWGHRQLLFLLHELPEGKQGREEGIAGKK